MYTYVSVCLYMFASPILISESGDWLSPELCVNIRPLEDTKVRTSQLLTVGDNTMGEGRACELKATVMIIILGP